MADERAMTEDEIESMAWQLETKMMEIRGDPRAALTDGLAKIRSMMLAEYKAYMAKKKADLDAEFAALEAAKVAKLEAILESKLRARMEAAEAKIEAMLAELRAACAERLRQRKAAELAPPALQ
jgi:hypothetical protein